MFPRNFYAQERKSIDTHNCDTHERAYALLRNGSAARNAAAHACAAMVMLMALPGCASSAIVDFRADFIETIDERPSFELRIDSRSLQVSTSFGVLNRTSRSFGINAPGGGDDADGIDGARGSETMHFAFDDAVALVSAELSGFGGNDRARFAIDTATSGVHDLLVSDSGRFDFGGIVLAPGARFSLHHVQGNGVSLDALEFSAVAHPVMPPTGPSQVTGPATVSVMGPAFILLAAARWIRTRMRPGKRRFRR